MEASLPCGRDEVRIRIPDDAIVYESRYPAPSASAAELALEAVRNPIGAPPLAKCLRSRGEGDVVVVVSDVTRPIPYASFLPRLLEEIEAADVGRDEVLVLVATGMHRATTPAERREMFGELAGRCRIVDHDATDEENLLELPGASWSGARVRLNRCYVQAGFRMVTGLVEPHFMAGFSGGRKAVCPGLVGMESITRFHGEPFLSSPRARNGNLAGNPLHQEALSVARLAGADFSLNVVVNRQRQVVRAFAGELEAAHARACRFVSTCACPTVAARVHVAVSSSGGYPLDATFYQCVKAMVGCLPAIVQGGAAIVFGGCSEGIGSAEYAGLMKHYAGRWREFLDDIRKPGAFTRDQWEFQMQCRALAHLGQENLHFITDGLGRDELSQLSVNACAVEPGGVQAAVQGLLDELLEDGKTLAVFPEGPYCTPLRAEA